MCLIYVYCITTGLKEEKVYLDSLTVSNENYIEAVNFKDIQAITSIVNPEEFSEGFLKGHFNNLEWVRDKAFAHESIIEEIMENAPVLPMRFCIIYESKKNLLDFLASYYEKIKSCLSLAKHNEEWSVKVFCDNGVLKKAIMEMDTFKNELDIINKKPKGIAFMLMKKFEEKVEDCIQASINQDVQDIFEQIKKIVDDTVVKEIQDKNTSEKEMILNTVMLVNKAGYDNFSKKIEVLNNKYINKGYVIETSGPWPIYNFITLNEEL